jgi:hypothetical protein
LAALPIGVRDSLLFRARVHVFGPRLEIYAECPACGGSLESNVNIADLPLSPCSEIELAAAPAAVYETDGGLRYRLPDSYDLAATLACDDADAAERMLAERCIVGGALKDGETRVRDLNEALAAHDPAGDLELAMHCPACGGSWSVVLDIAAYFWRELNAFAKRLLAEVHTLASAYGWAEKDILEMSPARRSIYLEMAAG